MNQFATPLADALRKQAAADYVPFDVPGHKGRHPLLSEFFGERLLALDKNSRESIDYLCQPRGVISDAQKLAAEAFGAAYAHFMIGGTTSSVQAMVMSACAPGEKIILPRNVHYSVINAVILAGAVPIYIDPCVHPNIGISLGMRLESIRECIDQNPDAKAILVNNPTYYGVCSDIKSIVSLAHRHNIRVLADEAHGTHFYFGDGLPAAAMHCGADMAAVSLHKTGGSLTQSSVLLSNGSIDNGHVTNIINLTRSTSASYLLLASMDLARCYLATEGREVLNRNLEAVCSARRQINSISGLYAFEKECIDGDSVFDFDLMKLAINTFGLGLAGIEVYTLLRDVYGVQLEFGDTGNVLALSTLGDTSEDYCRLVTALSDLQKKYGKDTLGSFSYEYISPTPVISPRDAFYSPKKTVPISECENLVCANSVMLYPPGIPILAPGELITRRIIEHIIYATQKGCSVTGLSEDGCVDVVNDQ